MKSTLLLIVAGFLTSVSAQSPSALKSVNISAAVTATGDGVFKYEYSVNDSQESAGAIWLLSIDVSKPLNSVNLTNVGLVNDSCFLQDISMAAMQQSGAVATVPIAISCPNNWLGSITVLG